MIFTDITLLVIGIVIGIIPAYLWGKFGGDEHYQNHEILYKVLKYIHHWFIGVVLIAVSIWISNMILLGMGTVMYLDDALFHSFENYFMRKVDSMIAKSREEDNSLYETIRKDIERHNSENEEDYGVIDVDCD